MDGMLFLVSSPSKVYGYVFQEGAEWDYSDDNRQSKDQLRSIELGSFPIYSIKRDEVRAFKPGDYVSVKCVITRFEEFQEGLYYCGSRYISISAGYD